MENIRNNNVTTIRRVLWSNPWCKIKGGQVEMLVCQHWKHYDRAIWCQLSRDETGCLWTWRVYNMLSAIETEPWVHPFHYLLVYSFYLSLSRSPQLLQVCVVAKIAAIRHSLRNKTKRETRTDVDFRMATVSHQTTIKRPRSIRADKWFSTATFFCRTSF